jgi:hypothetical protein
VAERPILTTDAGMPVSENQDSVTTGPRGPVLTHDFVLFEKLAHRNRERIPERAIVAAILHTGLAGLAAGADEGARARLDRSRVKTVFDIVAQGGGSGFRLLSV